MFLNKIVDICRGLGIYLAIGSKAKQSWVRCLPEFECESRLNDAMSFDDLDLSFTDVANHSPCPIEKPIKAYNS
jgi:hypothetical protein